MVVTRMIRKVEPDLQIARTEDGVLAISGSVTRHFPNTQEAKDWLWGIALKGMARDFDEFFEEPLAKWGK